MDHNRQFAKSPINSQALIARIANDGIAAKGYAGGMAFDRIRRGARLHAYVSEHLEDKGWSQGRLAGIMNVDASVITRYKQKGWNIELDTLEHIAYCLGLSDPMDIFKLPEPKPVAKKPRKEAQEPSLAELAAQVAELTKLVSSRK